MIKDKLMEDFKSAMKNNDTIRKNTIQLLRSSILQAEKENMSVLTDEQAQEIIAKEKKKRIEALAQFESAKRADLIEQTHKELLCIESYLPKQISESEVRKIVQQIIVDENAKSRDVGKVIRKAKEQIGLKSDARVISNIVKELLIIE